MSFDLKLASFITQFVESQELRDIISNLDDKYKNYSGKDIVESGDINILKYLKYRGGPLDIEKIIFWSYVLNKQQFIEYCNNNFPKKDIIENKLDAYSYTGKK